MTPNPNHPLIFCVFGIHNWEHVQYQNAGGVAELGRYIFLPNTEEIFECAKCRKRKSIITDFRGDVIS